jgi:hypothetical protein
MQARLVLSILTTGIVAMGAQTATAQNRTAALDGQVTSDAEGALEGVLVSAKKAGSTVTVTVISDAQGRYTFQLIGSRRENIPSRYVPSATTSRPRRPRTSPMSGPRPSI